MKKALLLLAFCAIIAPCLAQKPYYQVYKTAPTTDNIDVNDIFMAYEDSCCKIVYNFWREYGEMGFVFINKIDENIYLHLDETFYVANGYVNDYYKNRVYNCAPVLDDTRSSINSEPNDYSNGFSQAKALTMTEKPVVCVPAHASRAIKEYNIKNYIFRSEEIFLFPGKKDNNILEFSKAESPFVFGNIVAYSVGNSQDIVRVENEFYVSSIANYAEGKTDALFERGFPDGFFIPYFKTKEDNAKH